MWGIEDSMRPGARANAISLLCPEHHTRQRPKSYFIFTFLTLLLLLHLYNVILNTIFLNLGIML